MEEILRNFFDIISGIYDDFLVVVNDYGFFDDLAFVINSLLNGVLNLFREIPETDIVLIEGPHIALTFTTIIFIISISMICKMLGAIFGAIASVFGADKKGFKL